LSEFEDLAMTLGELFLHGVHGCAALHGLDVVHLRALYFLKRANRYSNTPAALGDYLGLTKGTVSKSISLLEKMGYLTKSADEQDRRVVRLHLTESGSLLTHRLLEHIGFSAIGRIMGEGEVVQTNRSLKGVLQAAQRFNQRRTFGICGTCRNFLTTVGGYFCNLTKEQLMPVQSTKICREHVPRPD
jgi:MarR family transcriptional repressor of emrRAB